MVSPSEPGGEGLQVRSLHRRAAPDAQARGGVAVGLDVVGDLDEWMLCATPILNNYIKNKRERKQTKPNQTKPNQTKQNKKGCERTKEQMHTIHRTPSVSKSAANSLVCAALRASVRQTLVLERTAESSARKSTQSLPATNLSSTPRFAFARSIEPCNGVFVRDRG